MSGTGQDAPMDPQMLENALQQIQLGLSAFLAMQQIVMQQQQGQQAQIGDEQLGQNLAQFAALASSIVNASGDLGTLSTGNQQQETKESDNNNGNLRENDAKRQRDLAIIGKRWYYVSDVRSFEEFEQLRCRHQVSRNRTFAHGIRYSCTQKTQMRSNCPYLLLCLFSDGAGEHSAAGVGCISVYSRNEHTHPVKEIKARQPRRFAKLGKKRKEAKEEEEAKKKKAREEEEAEKEEKESAGGQEEAGEPETGKSAGGQQGVDPNRLMEVLAELSRQLASQSAAECMKEEQG